MPWELEIHHIDVGQGDSTLIIARHRLNGVINYTRSALIDGGRLDQTATIDNYITNTAGVQSLDVMVATHYDADHVNGLRGLLNSPVNTYNTVRIYDQGHPQGNWDDSYHRYCMAINNNHQQNVGGGQRNRTRFTDNVLSDNVATILPLAGVGQPAVPAGGAADINGPADTLVGEEILWPGAQNIPAGQKPYIFCIAANGYVLQEPKVTVFLGGLGMAFDANGKSLAFLVMFNNFKYYIGGDIETTQEDGNGNNNGIMHLLNPNDNLAGRVHAMKTSHHGSDRSTSAAFVNRLRSSAAFISCGHNNNFTHPRPIVLTNLQNCVNLQHYYLTEDRNDAAFNTRVGAVLGPAPNIAGAYTPKAVVAGSWGPPADAAPNIQHGNIVLTVTQAQSMQPPNGALQAAPLSRFTVTGFSADSVLAAVFNNDHI